MYMSTESVSLCLSTTQPDAIAPSFLKTFYHSPSTELDLPKVPSVKYQTIPMLLLLNLILVLGSKTFVFCHLNQESRQDCWPSSQ